MSEDETETERTIDVFIAYDDPEHVAAIRSAMAHEVPPRILGPTLAEVSQLLLAGSISVRLFVSGLIEWTQKVRGITLVCERDPQDGTIVVRPEESKNVRRVIVAAPDGRTKVFEAPNSQSGEIASAIRALTRSSDEHLDPG